MPSARLSLVGCLLLSACFHSAPVKTSPPPVVHPPYAPPPDAITLSASESWESGDGTLFVEVVDVIDHSSPCPPDVRCVWSGIVRQIIVNVTFEGETSVWRLNERAVRHVGPWRIEVLNVTGPRASLRLHRECPADAGCQ